MPFVLANKIIYYYGLLLLTSGDSNPHQKLVGARMAEVTGAIMIFLLIIISMSGKNPFVIWPLASFMAFPTGVILAFSAVKSQAIAGYYLTGFSFLSFALACCFVDECHQECRDDECGCCGIGELCWKIGKIIVNLVLNGLGFCFNGYSWTRNNVQKMINCCQSSQTDIENQANEQTPEQIELDEIITEQLEEQLNIEIPQQEYQTQIEHVEIPLPV
jgi:hypothetical protein